MASETITQNDLREILSRTVGSVPSEYKKLLWTNPSLSSGRSAFDLTFDNAYDAYEIIFSMDNGGYLFLPSVLAVVGNSPCGADFTHTSGGRYYRSVTLNGATLSFTTGYYNGSANVNACVPYKIYGIKYERVAPPQVEYPNYSTEEQQVGTWITGKPLYRKVMPIQSLPNNTTAVYAHGISNIGVVSRFTLCWYDTNDARFIMSPRIDAGGPRCTASMNSTNVIIEATGTNWSTRTRDVFFIMEYTKTTD